MAWRERQGYAGGERSVNSRIVGETFAAAGAYVMGRRMFNGGEIPWGEVPPFRAPVFVVTHRDRETLERQGGTSFTFVTGGIERAVGLAKDAAGGKDVAVAGGGTLLRQVLAAGLLDELELHIVPVLLGDGMRLFGDGLGLDVREGIELTPARVVETPEVTHIRYVIGPLGQARTRRSRRRRLTGWIVIALGGSALLRCSDPMTTEVQDGGTQVMICYLIQQELRSQDSGLVTGGQAR